MFVLLTYLLTYGYSVIIVSVTVMIFQLQLQSTR